MGGVLEKGQQKRSGPHKYFQGGKIGDAILRAFTEEVANGVWHANK